AQNEATTTVYSSNYDTYTVKYDSTAPTISLASPANNNQSNNQPTFTWSGSDSSSGIANYQLYIDSSLNTDNITGVSSGPSSTLSCGAHTWYIKAIDNAGNSVNSSTYNITITCGGGIPPAILQQMNRTNQDNDSNNNNKNEEAQGKTADPKIEEYKVEAAAIFEADVDNIVSLVKKERDIDLEIDVVKRYLTEIGAIAESKKEAATGYWQLMILNFITYGTPSTQILGQGERAGAVNSYRQAFGKLPKTEDEWLDVIKISNGRWPSEKNKEAEERARTNFNIVYLRNPDRNNSHDDAAITVMAYGLRPVNRNLDSEKAAIKSFKAIYGYNPVKATAWDVVRAIAYSGATR
ncbi:MAG: hypothetical protein AAB956_02350, partial [Patescibacteria group bacterium]